MNLEVEHLPVASIEPSPHNPRLFSEDDPDLQSLAESIRTHGVLQPILVRSVVHGVNKKPRYQLIAGERRWRASRDAGLKAVPAIVREGLSDGEALELTVTENLQREDLHPLEEANGVAALLEHGDDYRTVADRLGKSLGWVARRARLIHLTPAWRERAADPDGPYSRWSGAHFELVARLEPAVQDALLEDEYQALEYRAERLRVTELQGILVEYTRELKRFPWKLEDESLLPEAGACSACPKRSSCHPGLFEQAIDGKTAANDRCLDAHCFDAKMAKHLERRADALKKRHGSVAFVGDPFRSRERVPAFAQGKTVEPWRLRQTKKSTAGAFPVLVVAGPKAGTSYFAMQEEAFARPTAKTSTAPQSAKEKLETRQRRLEGRRKAHAVTAFREILENGNTKPPTSTNLWRLVAAFGTAHRCDDPGHANVPDSIAEFAGGDRFRFDPWKAFDQLADAAQTRGALWLGVREVLCRRLTFHNNEQAIERWGEVENVAPLVGEDAEAYLNKAIEAIPEPKAWMKLRAAAIAEGEMSEADG